MLQFILGRCGSGKTFAVQTALKELAESGREHLMLIVPEQSSFENERAMLRLLGAKDARKVFVTSFTRLVDAVQRQYGGFAGRRLDDGGRSIFMSLAIEQVKENLEVYRKNAENTELVGLMLQISAELKMCEVSPQNLVTAAGRGLQSTLKRKVREISLILDAYDALVSRSYIDPLDDLTRLKSILQQHDFFSGYTVMVDSFQSFTVQEYDILELILRQADDVRITLCADGLGDSDSGLFAIAQRTTKNLIRIASRNNIPIVSPVVLKNEIRFQNPELAALEAGVYRPVRKAQEQASGCVAIYEAKNRYDEAAFICAAIRNLVMKERYRYRDFAVITRSTNTYDGIIDSAMQHWEIPYFMDRPEVIDAEPLMRLTLAAFKIVQSGYRSDDIFLYLKTGLVGLTISQISELENYTFTWNLSGKKWKEEWIEHPNGFTNQFSQQDSELLSRINESRRTVIEPLERFAQRTNDADGESMAAAVYQLLCDVNVAENLRNYASRLAQSGDPALAERELRIWDLLMQILDQTALVIGTSTITRTRYAELFRLVILTSSIASIPQGLDEVTIGDANRIRTAEPKVVFLIGTSEGEFPMTPCGDRIFSDSERRELIRLGLPLNDTMEGVALQERFLAYSALSAASQRIYITYPAADSSGKALPPSSIPSEVRAVLPNIRILDETVVDPLWFACAEAPALELAAKKWNADDEISASLKELFRNRNYDDRLVSVDRAARKQPARFTDYKISRALFGNDMKVSATQIERFELCRFQYFCRFGLNVQERRSAELNALEYGSLMHFLLQRLFQNVGSEKIAGLSSEELHRLILCFLDEYIQQTFGGLETKTPRFSYLVSRIADSAQIVAVHIAQELLQSGFEPIDFELEIGNAIGTLTIPLPDGGEVRVDGKIDRVDIMDSDGVRYLRIVDYKTGKKDFKLSDIIYGINMQMLVYLAALCENGENRYGHFLAAGVLYMPANRPSVPAERGVEEKSVLSKTERQLRMDGLVLDDPQIISAMDHDANGQYLPVALKNGMPDKKDHVVSRHELESVLHYLRKLIGEMALELRHGEISAVPLSGKRYNACEWCPYHAVCGHEKEDPTREMQDWDRDAALREIFQEKGENKE